MKPSIISIATTLLTLILVVGFLSSCSRPDSFESEYRYISVFNASRSYHFQIKGKLDEGADVAGSYEGQLLIYQDKSSHRIDVKSENFAPKLADFQSSGSFGEYELGMDIDSNFFSTLLVKIDSSLSKAYAQQEAAEVFEALKLAGMGPKIGTRPFEMINLEAQEHKYY